MSSCSNLPDLSGIEIYKEIQALNKDQQIIFITGYSQDRIPDLELSNVDWIQKPFKLEQLDIILQQKLKDNQNSLGRKRDEI